MTSMDLIAIAVIALIGIVALYRRWSREDVDKTAEQRDKDWRDSQW